MCRTDLAHHVSPLFFVDFSSLTEQCHLHVIFILFCKIDLSALLLCSDKCESRVQHYHPLVHVADINHVLSFNGQGTYLAGRARAAQVLLRYRASYSGFIDRRTRATDVQAQTAPLNSSPVRTRSSRSHTPPIPDKPIRLAEERSTSSLRGYSPSPPFINQEMSQPIDLSSLLNLPGRGRDLT